MTGPFASVVILTCKGSNGGFHGKLLVGYCGPGNYSIIFSGGGCFLGCLSVLQYG